MSKSKHPKDRKPSLAERRRFLLSAGAAAAGAGFVAHELAAGRTALAGETAAPGTVQIAAAETPIGPKWWPSKWGAEDQVGASNHITPEKVMAATALIKTGKIYSLGQVYQPEMPLFGSRAFAIRIPGSPTGGVFGNNKIIWNDEFLATEIGQAGRPHRAGVEVRVPMPPLLVQHPLALRGGGGAARADANPDASPVAHRRRVRRPDRHHRHPGPVEHARLDRHGGRRHDVPVGLDVGQLEQQLVRDRCRRGLAVVPRPHEHDARPPMVRQVVGERAHRLSDLHRSVAPQRFLPLHEVGLQVRHHGGQLCIRIAGGRKRRVAHGAGYCGVPTAHNSDGHPEPGRRPSRGESSG